MLQNDLPANALAMDNGGLPESPIGEPPGIPGPINDPIPEPPPAQDPPSPEPPITDPPVPGTEPDA